MEWSRDKTLEFISCYKSYDYIWDCKHELYKDRLKRHKALEELANKFGTQTTEVERKIKNLQSHFLRERKRVQLTKNKTATWFAYKPLSFLLCRNKPERRKRQIQTPKQNAVESGDNTSVALTFTHLNKDPTKTRKLNQNASCSMESTPSPQEYRKNHQEFPESYPVMKELFKWFKDRDEFDLYGEQVAIKLRNISSPFARVAVQNRMNMLLMEAEIGMLDNENHYTAPTVEFYPETKVDVEESSIHGT